MSTDSCGRIPAAMIAAFGLRRRRHPTVQSRQADATGVSIRAGANRQCRALLDSVPNPGSRRPGVIVGVDTHKDLHVATAITSLVVLLASKAFPTTRAGRQALVKWRAGSVACGVRAWNR